MANKLMITINLGAAGLVGLELEEDTIPYSTDEIVNHWKRLQEVGQKIRDITGDTSISQPQVKADDPRVGIFEVAEVERTSDKTFKVRTDEPAFAKFGVPMYADRVPPQLTEALHMLAVGEKMQFKKGSARIATEFIGSSDRVRVSREMV